MSHLNKWEREGLYREFSNKISGEEVLKFNLEIQGDSRFDDIRYVINDFTNIVDFDFSDLDVQKIAAIDNAASKSNPDIKVALISNSDPLLVWFNNYCDAMKGSKYVCKIFANTDDAYEWVSE